MAFNVREFRGTRYEVVEYTQPCKIILKKKKIVLHMVVLRTFIGQYSYKCFKREILNIHIGFENLSFLSGDIGDWIFFQVADKQRGKKYSFLIFSPLRFPTKAYVYLGQASPIV